MPVIVCQTCELEIVVTPDMFDFLSGGLSVIECMDCANLRTRVRRNNFIARKKHKEPVREYEDG